MRFGSDLRETDSSAAEGLEGLGGLAGQTTADQGLPDSEGLEDVSEAEELCEQVRDAASQPKAHSRPNPKHIHARASVR